MLRELHIKDFAIIDELHLALEPGFNILTGETGAGKSILIDAVALLLGGRADTSAIRRGAQRGRIEGLFLLSPEQQRQLFPVLEREGLEGESPETLWLSRELRDSGRTIARVNGSVVSLGLMREVAEGLVDIHGQSEHLSLLRVREHLNLLDRFAGLEELRAGVSAKVRELQSVRRELHELQQSEQERMQRVDLLRFQIEEIEAANLKPGEEEELEGELVRLANAEQLASLASNVLALLEEGGEELPPVFDILGQARKDMINLSRIDASLTAQDQTLEEVIYQLEDLTRTIRSYLVDIEFNPKRLTWVQNRLALLHQLERKYGEDLHAVLSHAKMASAELETLEHSDERIAELQEVERHLMDDTAGLSLQLSERRRQAAVTLSAGVESELNDLRMRGARFGVRFEWAETAEGLPLEPPVPSGATATGEGVAFEAEESVSRVAFDPTGIDRLEFLIEPNVGEGLKPITRIASGGEMARLMLALKTVLSRADHTSTLIFDEIDQGIGGRIGAVVGAKLWRLTSSGPEEGAVRHQVLCITHMPQLAGFGDVHFQVQKQVVDERTLTRTVRLSEEDRVAELALMLGTHGEAAEQGALELLSEAVAIKRQVETV